ncbi:MAG: O-antigen ligase family protein, partial [Rhodoferax sp.]|nr:O-antigen ligase family protein [Rhodoferax sp.]
MQQTKRLPVGMGSLRLTVLCLAAASVSLPMAWISLAKLGLLLTVLLLAFTARSEASQAPAYTRLLSPWLVLASLLLFALSLCWTQVNLALASAMLVKHGKLILLLAFVYAIRNKAEAATVLKAFIWGQLFVLLSSWLLGLGLTLPWVLNDQNSRGTHNVVFSESYLDQSIMMAALAGVLWQLRSTWKWPTALTLVLALLALLNPVVLLEGRTGQVAGFCVLLLALFWALPKPWRTAGMVVVPLLLALVLALGSERISSRLAQVYQESVSYAQQGNTDTSSGWRINAWHRSLQAIAQQPVTGHGVGSFTL